MRKVLPILLLSCLSFFSTYSQIAAHYDFSIPIGEMGTRINQVHGLILSMESPIKKLPLSIGGEVGFNFYGMKTLEQELPFHNGYITKTDVHYTTSFTTYAGTLKFQKRSENNIQPYAMVKAGVLHFHSNMTIDDPEDPLGCEALDKKVLLKDFTWMASLGAGTSMNWQVFKKSSTSSIVLNLGAFYTVGGPADYLKMSKSGDPVDPKGKLYYVRFEHVPTGEVHEHSIGKVYNSVTNLLTLRLGVTFKLN